MMWSWLRSGSFSVGDFFKSIDGHCFDINCPVVGEPTSLISTCVECWSVTSAVLSAKVWESRILDHCIRKYFWSSSVYVPDLTVHLRWSCLWTTLARTVRAFNLLRYGTVASKTSSLRSFFLFTHQARLPPLHFYICTHTYCGPTNVGLTRTHIHVTTIHCYLDFSLHVSLSDLVNNIHTVPCLYLHPYSFMRTSICFDALKSILL